VTSAVIHVHLPFHMKNITWFLRRCRQLFTEQ